LQNLPSNVICVSTCRFQALTLQSGLIDETLACSYVPCELAPYEIEFARLWHPILLQAADQILLPRNLTNKKDKSNEQVRRLILPRVII